MKVKTFVTATVAAIIVLSTPFLMAGPAAAAGPRFPVMNTSEQPPDGVWFRNSGNVNDTDRVTGHGVYAGDIIEEQCYIWGDPVGAYANRLWYFVANITRPTVPDSGVQNTGYLNAHYINDGTNANQVVSGVNPCGALPPPPPPPANTASHVTYYSGLGSAGAQAARDLGIARVLTDNGSFDGRWHPSTQCSPDSSAVNFAGKDITRLGGWSLGRLGPIYALKYLKDHNGTDQARHINYIVLFDPGAPAEFGTCDYNHPNVRADQTLAWWLGLSTSNHLIIMSGNDTATNHHQTIQTAYFPAIKNAGTTVRQRVLVCNYSLNHQDTYYHNAHVMTDNTQIPTTQGLTSCPTQGGQQVWGWNP
jgi:hypothetical protein